MRWECGAPLWAWCCCARGMSCGRRWKATRRWRREELRERNAGEKIETYSRYDNPAVSRPPPGARARAGSFRAHPRMRRLPHAAASAGARIAAVAPGNAGRRRTAAFAAGAISGAGPQIDAMDLGSGFRTGGDGNLRTLYRIYPAVAAAIGTSRIRRIEPAGPADFSGRLLERMAIPDHTPRSAGDGDADGTGSDVLPAPDPARVGAGDGVRRVVRIAGAAIACRGHRIQEGRQRYGCER